MSENLGNFTCPICGQAQFRNLHSFPYTVRVKTGKMRWNVSIVNCQTCNFVFQGPGPSPEKLDHFFSNQYGYSVVSNLDFSPEKRVKQIEVAAKYMECSGGFVDIGAGLSSSHYLDKIDASIFHSITCCEPNHDADVLDKDVTTIRNDYYSMIVAYDVLHHIPSPISWLRMVLAKLKFGGVLLIEVPNLRKYSKGENFNFLTHGEILNHFSPRTLSVIAESNGLEVLEICNEGSREDRIFGLFKKSLRRVVKSVDVDTSRAQNSELRVLFNETLKNLHAFERRLGEARKLISRRVADYETVVVWGANRICEQLLDGFEVVPVVTIVDMNREKENFFDEYGVLQPLEAADQISRASLFIFCISSVNHEDVKSTILNVCARQVAIGEIVSLVD